MDLKATDLRIGNYLKYDITDDFLIVTELSQTKIKAYFLDGSGYRESNFEPIKITEDILLRLGFKSTIIGIDLNFYKNVKLFNEEEYSFEFELEYFNNSKFMFWINDNCIELIYVHQLQNIFHSLTNKELKLKEQ